MGRGKGEGAMGRGRFQRWTNDGGGCLEGA